MRSSFLTCVLSYLKCNYFSVMVILRIFAPFSPPPPFFFFHKGSGQLIHATHLHFYNDASCTKYSQAMQLPLFSSRKPENTHSHFLLIFSQIFPALFYPYHIEVNICKKISVTMVTLSLSQPFAKFDVFSSFICSL